MLEQLTRHWWVPALRGVAAILFAVIAFSQPGVALTALVWLWGAYAFVDGVLAVVTAVRAGEHGQPWGMLLLEGICGIAAGFIAFTMTGMTALVLAYLVAAWAIVTGMAEIAAAVGLRELIEGEWLLGLSGVLSIVFGALIIARPGAGQVALVWMIGVYALLFGIVLIALGVKLRALGQGTATRSAAA